MDRIERRYCAVCDEYTKCVSTRVSHIFHLLMSLITGGLWLIIWLMLTLSADRNWRCDTCGARIRHGAAARKEKRLKAERAAKSAEATAGLLAPAEPSVHPAVMVAVGAALLVFLAAMASVIGYLPE